MEKLSWYNGFPRREYNSGPHKYEGVLSTRANRDYRPWESVALTTRHPLSAKVITTSPTRGGRSVGIVRSRTKATKFSLVTTRASHCMTPSVHNYNPIFLCLPISLLPLLTSSLGALTHRTSGYCKFFFECFCTSNSVYFTARFMH
jgi:hypothetical protein